MKKLVTILIVALCTTYCIAQGYVDDIYYSPKLDKQVITKSNKSFSDDTVFYSLAKRNANGEITSYDEGYYLESENKDQSQEPSYTTYDDEDFVYTTRIKRYHNPVIIIDDPYYDDYQLNLGIGIGLSLINIGLYHTPFYWGYRPYYWSYRPYYWGYRPYYSSYWHNWNYYHYGHYWRPYHHGYYYHSRYHYPVRRYSSLENHRRDFRSGLRSGKIYNNRSNEKSSINTRVGSANRYSSTYRNSNTNRGKNERSASNYRSSNNNNRSSYSRENNSSKSNITRRSSENSRSSNYNNSSRTNSYSSSSSSRNRSSFSNSRSGSYGGSSRSGGGRSGGGRR